MKKNTKIPRGRPKSDEQRKIFTGLRLSTAEVQMLRDAADAAGVTLSQYVRRRLGLPETGYVRKN